MKIERFCFNDSGRQLVGEKSQGKDWPIVYIINNDQKLYVGETTSIYNRFGQHLSDPHKEGLEAIRIIFDDEFNKSAILDIEQSLIQLFGADNKYLLLNRNSGQSSKHNYYQRERYRNKVPEIWENLRTENIANNAYADLTNTDLFKYSPYITLTAEQKRVSNEVLESIIDSLEQGINTTCIIHGSAGTGKTIVAINTIFQIVYYNNQNVDVVNPDPDEELDERFNTLFHRYRSYIIAHGDISVGFVFPMVSLRNTIKAVFRATGNGLTSSLIIGPNDVKDKKYDILFVDESHRLAQRRNISAMGAYDNVCRQLGFNNPQTTTQLDWIIKQSKCRVLFYDENQSVKGSDISFADFNRIVNATNRRDFFLKTQMRCLGGTDFVDFLDNVLVECNATTQIHPINFDCIVFEDPNEMISRIKCLNATYGLCRTVAGYSWKWETKGLTYEQAVNSGKYDITLDGKHYIWNTTANAWILSDNAVNEIGCVHTSQGYDLNYVAVVFGHEIDYDPQNNTITIDRSKFFDVNVKRSVNDDELKAFIVNTYKVMLTRGIRGCFMYACNKNLQNYLKQYFEVKEYNQAQVIEMEQPALPAESDTPYLIEPEISSELMYEDFLPLFTMKAACGYFGESEQVGEYDWIRADGVGRLNHDMFVVQASGHSMEPKISDGDYCVFEKYSGGSRNGEIVLAQHVGYTDEDNMGSYSIKEYHSEKVSTNDGSWEHTSIILHPLNREYSDIVINDYDAESFKIIGIYKGKISTIDRDVN